MTQFLSSIAPVANHLWQSTAFAVAAYLVTLLLRRNRASVRYGLWLAASVKFLIPFSLLIGLGGLLPKPQHIIAGSQTVMYSAMDAVGQPFSDFATEHVPVAKYPSLEQNFLNALPMILLGAWLVGFAAVLLVWAVRWHQVSATLRRSVPTEDGREVQSLRQMEQAMSMRKPVPLLLSQELMEPGIFGIFRPLLIWPEPLSERLADVHIEAILVHELMHVRRRDNLAAAMHMVVEAAFWFHPMAWWMERQMVEERERACDEAVVEMGSKPGIYADSLLKACRFCVESPLTCVAGVTGADLRKRVRSIMTLRLEKLSFVKKLALAAIGLAVVAGPVAFGLMQQTTRAGQILHATGPLPSFEVATIKPNHSGSGFASFAVPEIAAPRDRFIATNTTIKGLILWAWAPGTTRPLPEDQVVGGPSWINSDRFDIDAKLESSQIAALEKLAAPDRSVQIKLMVQSLLADRFKLLVNDDTTAPRPAYALVVAKGGSKLKETAPCGMHNPPTLPPPPPPPPGTSTTAPQRPATAPRAGGMFMRPGEMMACAIPTSDFARQLQLELGRPVLDQTGLKGNYTFELNWTPDLNTQGAMPGPSPSAETGPPDASGPSIFTAVQEQLGLKLESTKDLEEAIAIVHIEKPSEN